MWLRLPAARSKFIVTGRRRGQRIMPQIVPRSRTL
jgi:hypothetical protein